MHRYSLPVADTLLALTTALPVVAGSVVQVSAIVPTFLAQHQSLTAFLQSRNLPPYFLSNVLSFTALLVYETVVATLAGIHISPREALQCAIEQKWRDLFRAKDSRSIARTQDAFQCCGLRTSHDMAFPFPDAHHSANACEQRYDRHVGCLNALIDQERYLGGWILVVVVGVFLWIVSLQRAIFTVFDAYIDPGRRYYRQAYI